MKIGFVSKAIQNHFLHFPKPFQNKKDQNNLRYPRKKSFFVGYLKCFGPFYFEAAVVASENLVLCIWSRTNQVNENWFCIQSYPKSFFALTEFGQIKQKDENGSCLRLLNSNVCLIYHTKVHMASYNFFKNSYSYLWTN